MVNESRNMKNFNLVREIYNVIGCICRDTELLRNGDVDLKPDDFMQDIHKIIFSSINNIVYNASGDKVSVVTPKDIDNYLSSLPTQYKKWKDQNGYDYVEQTIKHANKETFMQSYDRIKKMSVLREYQKNGFDVSELYDWNSDDFLNREKTLLELDKMKLKDIFEFFTLTQLRIKDKYNIETNSKNFRAGQNIREMLDKFRQGPDYGYPFVNGFENYIIRGMRKGKFMLRSGATGTMKTSLGIADMVRVSIPRYYNKGEWHYNGVSLPSLFISTELDQEELDTIVLANVTGIPRKKIMDGVFTKQEEELLIEAGEIIRESPFFLVHIPDFSVADVEEIIERHILDHDVQYIAFDYIQNTPKLDRSVNELFGSIQRQDQILLYLSSSLKQLAEKYNVFIESFTQLNRNRKEEDKRDADSLRGSSAIADKIDTGMLLFRAKQSDKEKVKSIIEENDFKKEPNFTRWIYKNRAGQTDLIIWSHLNFSTVREEVLFVTNYDFEIVDDIKDLQFEFKEGRTKRDFYKEEKYAGDDDAEVFGKIDTDNASDEIDF